jgi:large subunit ribosomal protein L25
MTFFAERDKDVWARVALIAGFGAGAIYCFAEAVFTRGRYDECLPDEIPESFTVEVTNLDLGQSLRAGDVPLSGNMKLVTHADIVLCHVVTIRTTEEAAPAEAVAAPDAAKSEPEVIKKGKKEEEGSAPAGGKEKKK